MTTVTAAVTTAVLGCAPLAVLIGKCRGPPSCRILPAEGAEAQARMPGHDGITASDMYLYWGGVGARNRRVKDFQIEGGRKCRHRAINGSIKLMISRKRRDRPAASCSSSPAATSRHKKPRSPPRRNKPRMSLNDCLRAPCRPSKRKSLGNTIDLQITSKERAQLNFILVIHRRPKLPIETTDLPDSPTSNVTSECDTRYSRLRLGSGAVMRGKAVDTKHERGKEVDTKHEPPSCEQASGSDAVITRRDTPCPWKPHCM
ncbi:hypothetical protein B0H14DRAFT_2575539 [Mycena olivaceomarginata]|nr:hypothetical protein B0H14DRAFT_2575539 [Mycena olivaceomarginata]